MFTKPLSSTNPYPTMVSLPTSLPDDAALRSMSLPTSLTENPKVSVLIAGTSRASHPMTVAPPKSTDNALAKAIACGVVLVGSLWWLDKVSEERTKAAQALTR
ncbi:MAG: hypothetical protein ACHREM_00370 [Polyangiales bacterium]